MIGKRLSMARDGMNDSAHRAYGLTRRYVDSLLFERRYGIETSGRVGLEELRAAAAERQDYESASWSSLRRILSPIEVGDQDVFIDYGSGRGRVVFQAALYPFKRVLGVEVADELNAVAKRDIDRNHYRLRCQDIQLVTADALKYEPPPDVSVAYFHNPFPGNTFAEVIGKLIRSVDENPRMLRLIYENPTERALIEATGRLRLIRMGRGNIRRWVRSDSLLMYVVEPS